MQLILFSTGSCLKFFSILVTVVNFQIPTYLPKDDCTDSTVIDTSITKINLYSAIRYGDGNFIFQRSHGVIHTMPDSFNLYDEYPGYTYKFEVEDRAGNKGCPAYKSVGLPTVSVEEYIRLIKKETIYDVNSRRVKFPLVSGIYFTKKYGMFVVMEGKVIKFP